MNKCKPTVTLSQHNKYISLKKLHKGRKSAWVDDLPKLVAKTAVSILLTVMAAK